MDHPFLHDKVIKIVDLPQARDKPIALRKEAIRKWLVKWVDHSLRPVFCEDASGTSARFSRASVTNYGRSFVDEVSIWFPLVLSRLGRKA
jgi:hypothetical protein